eukprot:TRINITY_DN20454_c0_g1_i3.p1 TRINITY_DN20454_c0_g1~~TRINITY_DN20454_c0_g1_i3.p1  ORF type:complete len:505 (+),score=95.97 TRINITY_DN20454_c0_g1_i3:351-1865(+)
MGPASASSEEIQAEPGTPGTPSGVTAVAIGETEMELRWNAAEQRGSPITGYRILMRAGNTGHFHEVINDTKSGDTSVVVESLTGGTLYEFKVVAISQFGLSVASTPSAAVVVPASPDQPKEIELSRAGPRSLTLCWPSPDDNGTPILRYQILMSDSSSNGHPDREWRELLGDVDISHDSLTNLSIALVKNLTPFTEYRFKVTAISALGPSPESAPTEPCRTLPAAPDMLLDPPTVQQAPSLDPTGTTHTVRLSWVAPVDNGLPLTGYKVLMQSGGLGGFVERIKDSGSVVTSATIDNLRACTEFRFRVSAINHLGLAQLSDPTAPWMSPAAVPAAPPPPSTEHVASPSFRKAITLKWRSPDANGAPVTGYRLWIRNTDDPDPEWTLCVPDTGMAKEWFKVPDLAPDTGYMFGVAGMNKLGVGPMSNGSEPIRTSAAVPDRPTSVRAEMASEGGIKLTWAEPGRYNHVGGVVGYNVSVERSGCGAWSALGEGVVGERLELSLIHI